MTNLDEIITNISTDASYTQIKKKLGISYLGKVGQSMKMRLSVEHHVMTYCIYLAPSTMGGILPNGHQINVCPNSKYCKEFCLNGSGQNKCDELSRGVDGSLINRSRIKKTRLFYENRKVFMKMMIHEIESARSKAKREGYGFSVRINGTSDLSPLLFKDENGKNILELFDDVQFYDYTKVASRINLLEKYKNYDLCLSYNGHNWDECKDFLDKGGKVAVVFMNQKMPSKFHGYKVIDANQYDMRYLDPNGCIMGLHYHTTASNYYIDKADGKRKYRYPNSDFVVMDSNEFIEWF